MKKILEIVWWFKNLVYLCTRFREQTNSAFLIKQDDP